MRDKIVLSRMSGLADVRFDDNRLKNKNMISTIYHELWHISTWEKYEYMYEYVLDENTDEMTAFAYMYWIEYIAHTETVFMEDTEIMKKFCEDFASKRWHCIECGYWYFVKALPYYLARSNFLGVFDELTKMITCNELKNAVYEFNDISQKIIRNDDMQEIDKANIIRDMIEKLFE